MNKKNTGIDILALKLPLWYSDINNSVHENDIIDVFIFGNPVIWKYSFDPLQTLLALSGGFLNGKFARSISNLIADDIILVITGNRYLFWKVIHPSYYIVSE